MPKIMITRCDYEAREADIDLMISLEENSNGNSKEYAIKTFCHPFYFPANMRPFILDGFLVDNIWVDDSLRPPQKLSEGHYSYRITGEVSDVSKQHVKLGEYDFYLDRPIPKDIKNGDFISFDVVRIDLCFIDDAGNRIIC